jgi:hypothetical protein
MRMFEWLGLKRRRAAVDSLGLPILRDAPEVPGWRRDSPRKNVIVLGNCQARPLAGCLQALCADVTARAVEIPFTSLAQKFAQRDPQLHADLSAYDSILVQASFAPLIRDNFPDLAGKVRLFPVLVFSAYHPDLVYIRVSSTNSHLRGPLGEYNSALAFWGFTQGLCAADTVALFNDRTYEALGYFDFWNTARQSLLSEGVMAHLPLDGHLDRWSRAGCFMHSINHPKLFAVADIAKELLTQMGLASIPGAAEYLADEHADGPVWPVYPEIAERLGVDGHYYFKMEKGRCPDERPVVALKLREFVEGSFEAFAAHAQEDLVCERLAFEKFQMFRMASAEVAPQAAARSLSPRRTPYSGLPAHQFWKGALSGIPMEQVDPVVSVPFHLSRNTKVATAGSCFAQHISRTLQRNGFNYYIAETGETLSIDEAQRRHYGVFSARYGNLYTARQLLQLFERAYGIFVPIDTEWLRADGRYVDPFRPQIEPAGYASAQAVAVSRTAHLQAVRQMFETMDVLIFTLGLTEAWRSKADGAIFPLAPGVAGGEADFSRYEFINFRVNEVVADLQRFLARLREVNARARLILTVSPVPLLATYEPQHVLVATTYSKSVLRVAANEVSVRNPDCAYFPSFEIITGNYARGLYYDSDLRNVTDAGVAHVMRVFLKHFSSDKSVDAVDANLLKELGEVNQIVCDEEAISR